MYPRNAASPEPIAIGAVVQISDGAVQTSGCTVRIKPIGVAEGDGAGTTAYSTDGIVLYTPTQAETNYTSFVLIAKKTSCIPVAITVVTSASATAGYAGTDQSKITNATSTVNLSGTTIKTATDVETDTADIQTRIPAALTAGGNIKADVLAISEDATAADNLEAALDGTGGVTITAAVTGSITGNLSGSVGSVTGAVGSVTGNVGGNVVGSVASVTGAVGSVTGNVGGNVTGSVGSIATGGIAALSFAAGAIDAAAIATDAIGSAEIAASAVTKIQTGLSTLTAADIRTAVGLASANLDSQLADLPTNSELTTALAAADDAVLAAIAALNNLSAAQVNAEVVDALATDTYAEPGQGAPAATTTLAAKINYLYKAWRNKKTQTSSQFSLYADDTTTIDQKSAVTSDGTTTTLGEVATGP